MQHYVSFMWLVMFLLLISLCLVQDCHGNNGNKVPKAPCSAFEKPCLISVTSFNSSVSTSSRSTDTTDVFCMKKKCPSTSFLSPQLLRPSPHRHF